MKLFALLLTVALAPAWAQPDNCTSDYFNRQWKNSTNTVRPPKVAQTLVDNPTDLGELPVQNLATKEMLTINSYVDKYCTTSLLILKDNNVLYERYFQGKGRGDKFMSASMSKTIVALLIGIAVDEGKIKVTDKVTDIFPDFVGSAFDEDTVEDLLRMSSKARLVNSYDKDTLTDNQAVSPLAAPNGDQREYLRTRTVKNPVRTFDYNGAQTVLLALLLRQRVGMTLAEYMEKKLWGPIGAEDKGYWITNSKGQEGAGGHFVSTPRDYAKLGLLIMNKGKVGDTQVVSSSWIKAMTTVRKDGLQPAKPPFYGYQVWVPLLAGGRAILWGTNGQNVFVDPVAHVVIVHTASSPNADFEGNPAVFGLRDAVLKYVTN